MREGLSFDQIFPVRDAASAKLMRVKADGLLDAGVIDAEDRRRLYARTAAVLGYADLAGDYLPDVPLQSGWREGLSARS